MPETLFPRFLEARVSESLGDTRVTAVTGPRQSGKTTLIQKFTSDKRPYYTLDDPATYEAATYDPLGFVKRIEYGAIDEIQRVPELILAIKMSVDSDPRPGRFLLTGSADILTIPTISESLAGRMSINRLLPLSQAEVEGVHVSILDDLFEADDAPFKRTAYKVDDLEHRVLKGGYPEIQRKTSNRSRQEWLANYVETILSRDIKEILDAYRLTNLSQLIQATAIQSGQLVVHAEIAKRMGLDTKTVQRYMATLEQMYLLKYLPAWHSNELKRLLKTPKLHFLDSGLAAAIRQIDLPTIQSNHTLFEPLLKSFVFSELQKLSSFSDHWLSFHHFRDKDMAEVDFAISSSGNAFVGIEVKASATVRSRDFAGLRKLRLATGPSFRFGVLLYTGTRIVPFGDALFAAPVSVLWT